MAASMTRLLGPWLLAAATALPGVVQAQTCKPGSLRPDGKMMTAGDCVPDAIKGKTQPAVIDETMDDLSPAERKDVEELAAKRAGKTNAAPKTPPLYGDHTTVDNVAKGTKSSSKLQSDIVDAMNPYYHGNVNAVRAAGESTEASVDKMRELLGVKTRKNPYGITCTQHSLSNSGSFIQCLDKNGMPFEPVPGKQ